MSFPGEKKDDDDQYVPIGFDKTVVLQDSKIFSETPIKVQNCRQLLSKIIYILSQGEVLSPNEATKLFLNVTMLFQSNNLSLRRLVYLVIKELSNSADQLFVAVNTLSQDMTTSNEVSHANAIRTLKKIADPSTLAPIAKRHFTNSIVDKSPAVSSAALVIGMQMADTNPDIVNKWVTEAQEALRKPSPMVQYHALAFLYKIKQHDKLGVSKLVLGQIKKNLNSPLAHVLLVRFAKRVLYDNISESDKRTIMNYLEGCLHNPDEMVSYEAAHTLCTLDGINADQLSPAISVLQVQLSSYRPTVRFAAIQTLNKLANTHPAVVALCSTNIENLLSDSNKNIATLAITTLLKTGTAASLEKLMKQILAFMNEIQDEYKIVVVDAMKSLCLKYPGKYHIVLGFLSSALATEGGVDLKTSIVQTIETLMEKIPKAKESGLMMLCEFIEDCEYPSLLERILYILSRECKHVSNPSKFIRFINNRVILECAVVRAAAVLALAKIAAQIPKLRPSIIVLLKRALTDNTDEVRDRATLYKAVLETKNEELITEMLIKDLAVPIALLEHSLLQYKHSSTDQPFDITTVPTTMPARPEHAEVSPESPRAAALSPEVGAGSPATEEGVEELFASVPELAKLGKPFKSAVAMSLTEAETEYGVVCTKHIFEENIVFQYNCTNTVSAHLLENVGIEVTAHTEGLEEEFQVKASSLPFQATASVFVCMSKEAETMPFGTFNNVLKYVVKEVDDLGEPEEDGYEDEYPLDDMELQLFDYLRPWYCDFAEEWGAIEAERNQKFSFKGKTIETLVNTILDILSVSAYGNTQVVESKSAHKLLVAGQFLNGAGVLVKGAFIEKGGDVHLNLSVRCPDEDLLHEVFSAITQ